MILFENSYRSFRTKHLQNKKNATEIEEDKHLFDSEVLLKSPPPLFPRFLLEINIPLFWISAKMRMFVQTLKYGDKDSDRDR